MRKRSIIFILILMVLSVVLFTYFIFFSEKESKKNNLLQKKVTNSSGANMQGGGPKKASDFLETCNFFPIKKEKKVFLEMKENAGIAIFFNTTGDEQILYKNDIHKRLAPASLTKLMTAIIVDDNYPLEKNVNVSYEAIWTLGESGRLSPDEEISISGLLDIMLLVSSNDAASALVEVVGQKTFFGLVKEKINEIGLKDTNFVNPHGLDQENHYSSAYDFAQMIEYSIIHNPNVWEIMGTIEKDVFGKGIYGVIPHHAVNTNKILDWPGVIGGKTGFTDNAGECMILALDAPGRAEGRIVLVILGVDDRMERIKEFYNWIHKAYIWE